MEYPENVARDASQRALPRRSGQALAIVLTLAFGGGATSRRASAQGTGLDSYLSTHQMELRLSGGRLDGPAADWLRDEAAKARFLFIGEEHDTREIPLISGALWRDLVPLGYGHVAIEAGQWLGGRLDEYARSGDREAMGRFKASALPRRPNISVPPSSDEDIAFYKLLGEAIPPGMPPNIPTIWGLDHEFKITPLLKRLLDVVPDAGRRRRVESLLARVEASERSGSYDMQPFKAEIAAVVRDFPPTSGSEASQILDAMERRIAGVAGDQERGDVMKRLFLKNYRAAQGAGEARPRVVLRFGSYHGKRGLMSDFGTSTLGNFVAELAFAEEAGMLNVIFVSCSADGPGQTRHPRPCSPREKAWLKPLADVAAFRWTLFDLRGLRRRLRSASPEIGWELAEVIAGYDAVVWLKSSEPSHFSP